MQFDYLIVFSEAVWIGKKEDNPTELPLEIPASVHPPPFVLPLPAVSLGQDSPMKASLIPRYPRICVPWRNAVPPPPALLFPVWSLCFGR